MKTLYLTIAALAVTAVTSVNAQQISEQDYDLKNTANLESRIGFVGMGVGNEISRDNTYPEANVAARTNIQTQSPEQLNDMTPAAGGDMIITLPDQPAQPMQPTAPVMAQPVQPQAVAPATASQATMQPSMPQQNMIEMSQPQQAQAQAQATNNMNASAQTMTTSSVAPQAQAPVADEIVVLENNAAAAVATPEQKVIKTHTIIGNTDTGVNPDAVLKALEQNQN